MSTVIRAAKSPADVSSVIHHLPCSIAHTGEAPVSDYFLPTFRREKPSETPGEPCPSSENVHFTAAFRGRPLNGTKITLSPSYTGLLLEETSAKENSSLVKPPSVSQADWKVVAKFDSLSYWNWDRIPSDGDGVRQLLQWTRLAETAQKSVRDLMPAEENFIDSDTE